MSIWKFIFFTQWTYDKLERKLEQMEQSGYRLEFACFFFLFKFVPAPCKKTRYFVTYNMPKELGMLQCGYVLKCEYGANLIRSGYFFAPEIYRITQAIPTTKDFFLSDILEFRKNYFRGVIFQKFLLSLLFCISFLVCFLNSVSGSFLFRLFFFKFAVSLFLVIYYGFGLISIIYNSKVSTI